MRISDWSSDVCSSDLYLGGFKAEGQAIFDEVLAGKHDDGDAYRIARVYREAGEREKARVIFERYLAANPDDSRALSEVRAYTLLDGDREVAERLFRSEEHTSELQSLMRISYAVFCM